MQPENREVAFFQSSRRMIFLESLTFHDISTNGFLCLKQSVMIQLEFGKNKGDFIVYSRIVIPSCISIIIS